MSQEARLGWIEPEHAKLPLTRQCELAGVPRSSVYRWLDTASRQAREAEDDLKLRTLLDEEYTSRPFYGSRRMAVFLRTAGHVVNRKRVQRLMRSMGLAGMAPGPNTSKAHPENKVYPYLLRAVPVLLFEERVVHCRSIGAAEAVLTGQTEEILEDIFVNNLAKAYASSSPSSTANKRADNSTRQAA